MAVTDAEEARAVGRNGVVTLDEASAAARKLGKFTKAELAAELGVKPIAVSRWLVQLAERKMIEPDMDTSGLIYRAKMEPLKSEVFEPRVFDDEPAEAPEPEVQVGPNPSKDLELDDDEDEDYRQHGRVTAEEVRDWALMLERFTIYQLAKEMEVSYGTAKRYVASLVEQGILVDNGWKGAHDSVIYELRGEVAESELRRQKRRQPVEKEVLAKFGDIAHLERRGMEAITSGCPRVSNDKDVQQLAALSYAAGWSVEQRSKHYRIVSPAGTIIGVPSTPGKGFSRMRDELRRAGLPTLSFGDPNEQLEGPVARGAAVEDTSRTARRRQDGMNTTGHRRPGRTQGKKKVKNRHGKR